MVAVPILVALAAVASQRRPGASRPFRHTEQNLRFQSPRGPKQWATGTRTRLGATLVQGIFTCFRHFSWDMKLQTSHRMPASPQMKSEQRWQKVGLVSVTFLKL